MQDVPWWVSLIVSWLPFIAWILIWIWATRRLARELRTVDGRSIATVLDEYGRELKRSNDMNEQLLADVRKHPTARRD